MRLADAVSMYVQVRRLSGSPFVSSEITLRSFCRFCGDIDVVAVTADQVSLFCNNPTCAPVTRSSKFSAVKCFVDHYSARGEIPALWLLKPGKPREGRSPFIYTRAEIHTLLKTTKRCQEKAVELDAKTFRLLLLILYATGATVSEILALTWTSVDLRKRVIIVGTSYSKPSRSLPIGMDLADLLARQRKTGRAHEQDAFVLRCSGGGPVKRKNLEERFERLRVLAGLRRGVDGHAPRLQDFRYTFAVHRLNSWLHHGSDLNRLMPALSTYMGYASLTAAEQFLAFVPNRFKQDLQKLSPAKGRRPWGKDARLMSFLSSL